MKRYQDIFHLPEQS